MPPELSSPVVGRKARNLWEGVKWDGVRLTDSQLLPDSLVNDSFVGDEMGFDEGGDGFDFDEEGVEETVEE